MYMYEKTVLKASLLMDFKHLTSQQKLWGVQAGSQGGGGGNRCPILWNVTAVSCKKYRNMPAEYFWTRCGVARPSSSEKSKGIFRGPGTTAIGSLYQTPVFLQCWEDAWNNLASWKMSQVGCNVHVLFCIFYTYLAFYCCIYPVRRTASCRMLTVMADCWSWLTRLGRKMNFHMTVR